MTGDGWIDKSNMLSYMVLEKMKASENSRGGREDPWHDNTVATSADKNEVQC